MHKYITFEEGQILRYKGEGFEKFDLTQPIMIFLGYDSGSWTDLWVSYNGEKMRMTINEVEKADDEEPPVVGLG